MSDSGVAALISHYWLRELAYSFQVMWPEQRTETLFTFPPERYLFIYLHFDVLSNC